MLIVPPLRRSVVNFQQHPVALCRLLSQYYNRLHRMQEKIRRGNKEKITRESDRTPVRDRKSKQRNQLHKRQEKPITNRDVGVSHNRPCNARKSYYRLGKRTNHRERER